MDRRVSYTMMAYSILVGEEAPDAMGRRELRIAVMERWDGRKFDRERVRERVAALALCEIGLAWHPSDHYPYTWELVTERLREIMPELGAEEITACMLRDILTGRHWTQYAHRSS